MRRYTGIFDAVTRQSVFIAGISSHRSLRLCGSTVCRDKAALWKAEKKEIRILLLAALFLILINTAVKDIALTAFHTDLLQMLDTFAATHQIVP